MDELLKTLPEIISFDDVRGRRTRTYSFKRPHAFISEHGELLISGEHGDDLIDYYGDCRGGGPYIHPELIEWAVQHDGYWEWVHPGAICFVR
jgi:hypothetical protein